MNHHHSLKDVVETARSQATHDGRGMSKHYTHIDDPQFMPVQEETSHAQQPVAEDQVEASGGSLRDSGPDTGHLDSSTATDDTGPAETQLTAANPEEVNILERMYSPRGGNYPFPVYHRTGKKNEKGQPEVLPTIPPQPVNYRFDRRRFAVNEVKAVAEKLGYTLGRARFAYLIRALIPKMVQS